MAEESLTIRVSEATSVTAIRSKSEGTEQDIAFIYAPGAGSNLKDPFGIHLASVLPMQGIETWRFQFPYMEAGRKRPDAPALLQKTWRAVLETVALTFAGRVVIGGRSMGGRIASLVVADGAPVAGLVLFAYPLIPPGPAGKPRTEHLASISVPTLFCSGSRDSFGTTEQIEEAARLVSGANVHILEGADHGFAVLKASGRSRDEIWQEATRALLSFLERL